jgi:hypothetical protein
MRNAQRMRRFILSCVACLFLLPYFSALYKKRYDFFKKVTDRKVFDFLHNFFGKISHSKKNSARYYRRCTEVGA